MISRHGGFSTATCASSIPLVLPGRFPITLASLERLNPGSNLKPSPFSQRHRCEHSTATHQAIPRWQKYVDPKIYDPGPFWPQEKLLSNFRTCLNASNLTRAMEFYSKMDISLLRPSDTRALAGLITFHQRAALGKSDSGAPKKKGQVDRAMIDNYVSTVVSDLKNRRLAPDPFAGVFLLSYFKDLKAYETGKKYWTWLRRRRQDGTQVDSRTYGAALELLASSGTSLQELEALYQEALTFDPGNFGEYHLSPNAIVQNKSQYGFTPGSRLVLLQGIMTARLTHGDWRNAYLALDTALRLGVDLVPPRFFEAMMYERPVSEAWKIFLLACQVGIHLSPKILAVLLQRLGNCQSLGNLPSQNISLARAGVAALHALVATGVTPTAHHLTGLTTQLMESLYVLPQTRHEAPAQESALRTQADAVRFVINMFQKRGVQPLPSLWNMIISRALLLKRPELISLAASEIAASGAAPDRTTLRWLLTAGGEVRNRGVIEESWEALLETKGETFDIMTGSAPPISDWKNLATSCFKCDCKNYLEAQISKYEQLLNPSAIKSIRDHLRSLKHKPRELGTPRKLSTKEDVHDSTTKLFNALKALRDAMDSSKPSDLCASRIQTDMLWTSISLPDAPCKRVYDEVTSDPLQKSAEKEAAQVSAPRTSTGFPFEDMRFVAWKAVSELLIEAEVSEETRKVAVRDGSGADAPTMKLISPSVAQSEGKGKADGQLHESQDKAEDQPIPGANWVWQGRGKHPREWSDMDISSAILRLRGIERQASSNVA